MIKRILFAILSVVFVASCSGAGGGEVETGKPSITLSESTVTEFTLTFDVTVKNAFAASFVCVPSTSATPSDLDVLAKGTPIKVGQKESKTVYNLTPTTTYNIVVVAIDDNEVVSSSTLVMTTAEEPTNVKLQATATTHKSFAFSITPVNAEKVCYKVYEAGATATDSDILETGVSVNASAPSTHTLTPAKGNYFVAAVAKKGNTIVRAPNLDFTIAGAEVVNVQIDRVEAKDYGTDILYDVYIKNSEINVIKLDCYYHQGSTSAFGEFVYAKDVGYGKVVHSYSYTSYKTSGSYKTFFDGGTVKVESAANGQYTLKVNMTRADEKVYDFTWTGVIQWK